MSDTESDEHEEQEEETSVKKKGNGKEVTLNKKGEPAKRKMTPEMLDKLRLAREKAANIKRVASKEKTEEKIEKISTKLEKVKSKLPKTEIVEIQETEELKREALSDLEEEDKKVKKKKKPKKKPIVIVNQSESSSSSDDENQVIYIKNKRRNKRASARQPSPLPALTPPKEQAQKPKPISAAQIMRGGFSTG